MRNSFGSDNELVKKKIDQLRERLSIVYFELIEKMNNIAHVSIKKDSIVIRANDPYSAWDIIEEYCEDPVVINAYKLGNKYNVKLYCAPKNISIEFIVDGHVRIFYLDPFLALFKDEVFITG